MRSPAPGRRRTSPPSPVRAFPGVFGLCGLCGLLTAAAAQAQSAAPAPLLAAVVVTGSRIPEALDQTTSDLVALDAEQIRNSTASTLEELLRLEAGLQLQRNGGPGKAAGVMIRGATQGSTLVLVDGVRMGSATLGQAELEALSLAQIERIEVLRGPGSSLYGADAVGGVVQVFTRRGEGAPRVTASAAVGRYRSFDGSVGVSGSASAFDYSATLSRERSQGVSAIRPGDRNGYYNPDDDGYGRSTGQVRLGYTPAPGHRLGVSLIDSALVSQYDSGVYSSAPTPDPSPDFRTHLLTQVAAADYRGEIDPRWTTRVQLARGKDDSESGAGTTDRFLTRRDQLTWENTWKLHADHQVVAAYEYLREQAESTSYSADVQRENHALVVGYSGRLGAHVLQADLRHDHNSVYGDDTTGRLGWNYALTDELRLRALAGTTLKAPSFNDLYFPGYGIDTIKPERGVSTELGLHWRRAETEAALTLFRNRVRQLIEYESDRSLCPADPAYDFGCARNVGRARLQGATLAAGQRWGGFGLHGTVTLLDAKDTETGERLNRRAARQASLIADYDSGLWALGAAATNVGSRPDGNVRLGGYTTLDLRASWKLDPHWRLEAKLLNATNRDLQPVRDYQDLGRQAWFGVRYDGRGL